MIYLQCKLYTIIIYAIVFNNTNKKINDAKLFIASVIIKMAQSISRA